MTEKTLWKFRKPRSSRACIVCRMRKIRCNAEEQIPCNNCATFNCECRFPELKRRKRRNNSGKQLVTRSVVEIPMNVPEPAAPIVSGPPAVGVHPPPPPPAQYMMQQSLTPVSDYQYHSSQPIQYSSVGQQVPYGVTPQPSVISSHNNQNVSFTNGQATSNYHLPPLHQHTAGVERPARPGFGPEAEWSNAHQNSYVVAPGPVNGLHNQTDIPSSWTNGTTKAQTQSIPKPDTPNSDALDEQMSCQRVLQNISKVTLLVNTTDEPNNPGMKPTFQSRVNSFSYFGPTTCISYFTDSDGVSFASSSSDLTSEINDNLKKNYSHIKDDLPTEIAILGLKGSLKLPSKELGKKLVDCFFDHVYPHVPCINKEMFMKHFNDPNPKNAPPLILIQAILFLGSKYCKDPAILDSSGKASFATNTLYKRVTALLDATVRFEYEGSDEAPEGEYIFDYSTVLVQVLCLLSWYWDEPDDIAKGPYYWVRTAISVAQSYGFHRNPENLQAAKPYRHLLKSDYVIDQQCFFRKKIWWWLFTRDRSVSISFGRPLVIDLLYCDVPMITLEDYKYEPLWSADNAEDKLVAEYFIKTIELSEIIGFVVNEHCAVGDEVDVNRSHKVNKQLNIIMAYFFRHLPTSLKFNFHEKRSQNLYSAVLGSTYYITLYHVNKSRFAAVNGKSENNKYWGISFQSVYNSSLIAEYFGQRLLSGDTIVLPTQVIYTTSLTMILLTFHSDSSNKVVAKTAKTQNEACLNFLRLCYEIWPAITVMLITFFNARLNAENYKEAMLVRAKKLLFKICQKFEIKDTRESTNTMDTSFILDNNSKQTSDEFRLSDSDINDLSLPLHTFKTMKFPPLTSSSINNFRPSDLFPERTLQPQNAKIKTASPPSIENTPRPAGDASKNSVHTNTSPTFNYKDSFAPGLSTTTSDIANGSFDAPHSPENPLFNPNITPYVADPSDPAVKIEIAHHDHHLLDSQYFLHIDSGVDWSDYIM